MYALSGFIFLVVYSVYIIQLIYYLISIICYLYHNPKYRVFWAAFCIKQPIDTTQQISSGSHTISTSSSDIVFMDLSPSRSSDIGQSTNLTNQKQTDRSAFIHFGVETLSHCILVPLYLICLLFVICIRLVMCYITFRSIWGEYRVFCSYAPRLFSLTTISHYCLQTILCIPALRIQYMYNTTKCQRMVPIVSIIWFIICTPLEMSEFAIVHINEVKEYEGVMRCMHTGGTNPALSMYNFFGFYFSFILCFSTVIIPIYKQRKMLINLPKNEEVYTLITKVNALSKRLCVSAVVILTMFVIVNALNQMFPVRQQWLSVLHWSLYVEGYLMIGFIYKDWRIRLCPLCSYNHIQMNVCHTTQPTDVHQVEMGIELAPVSGMSSSVGVPNLIRDVSKDEIRENTRTFSQDASLPRFEIE
eukprot:537485_1